MVSSGNVNKRRGAADRHARKGIGWKGKVSELVSE